MESIEEHLATASALRGRIEANLRELLAEQDAMIARLEEVKRERDKTRRALNALAPEDLAPIKSERQVKRQPPPMQETLDRVLATLADGPGTVPQLTERSGLSRSAVQRSVLHLRADEQIRLMQAGKPGGPASIYGLMPSSTLVGVNGAA